jgi:hypothetical protein
MKTMVRLGFLISTLLAGCSYVKPIPRSLKATLKKSDTLYLLPVRARYVEMGFFLRKVDSARTRLIEKNAEAILSEELHRAFPAAILRRLDGVSALAKNPDNAFLIECHVKSFGRTPPREAVSEAINVLLMVPTFAMNMGFPLQTTSNVYIEIKKGGSGKPVLLKHRDMVDAFDDDDMRFQIRKILEPAWKG